MLLGPNNAGVVQSQPRGSKDDRMIGGCNDVEAEELLVRSNGELEQCCLMGDGTRGELLSINGFNSLRGCLRLNWDVVQEGKVGIDEAGGGS